MMLKGEAIMKSFFQKAKKSLISVLVVALLLGMVESVFIAQPQAFANEVPASVAVKLQEFRIVGDNGENINITVYNNNDPINVWFTQE